MQHIIASHHKRDRTVYLGNYDTTPQDDEDFPKCSKVANTSKTRISDFQCEVFYRDQIMDFRLSHVFRTCIFAVLFFCPYDFSPQCNADLRQIEESYSKFIERGAVPIAVTHDRAQIHFAYATPGKTGESLDFRPSFLLASDSKDKLISASFKSINKSTSEMIRSVVIVDKDLNILFSHQVPRKHRYFPMKSILSCFD